MPSIPALIAFGLTSMALIVIPGPSVLFIVGRAIALGRRAAVLTVFGNALGILLQVFAVAAGLGAIVSRSITLYTTIKLAGAAYLVFLGLQALRTKHQPPAAEQDPGQVKSPGKIVVEGAVVGLLNPKSIVFFAAILPQFLSTEAGASPATSQMAVLGMLFVAIALVLDTIWALAAGTARSWFASSPRRMGRLEKTGGVVMVGLGAKLALTD